MNQNEIESLIVRMSQTWNRRAIGDEWYDALKPVDAGKAGTAFIRLRDSEEHPPSIAKFLATCRMVQGDTPHDTPTCKHCDGTGLVGEYGMDISEPCRCPEGERMGALRERIASVPRLEDNRAPLGPSGYIATLMRREARGDQAAADELFGLPEVLLANYGAKAREIFEIWNREVA